VAYATETDVETLIAQYPLSGTTQLTSTQLASIIAQVEGEMNAALARHRVTVPFVSDSTAPQDSYAEYLTGISSRGSAAYALSSLFPGDDMPPGAKMLWEGYRDALKALKDPTCLPGWLADLVDVSAIPDGSADLALTSPTEKEAYFTRGQTW